VNAQSASPARILRQIDDDLLPSDDISSRQQVSFRLELAAHVAITLIYLIDML